MIPTCATCRFFEPDPVDINEVELFNEEGKELDPEVEIESGTCHFAAPQPVLFHFLADEEADTTTIWPAVDAEDWCGSYKMVDLKKGKKS